MKKRIRPAALALLMFAAVSALRASIVRGDDRPTAPAWEKPPYDAKDLMFAKPGLPAGWTLAPGSSEKPPAAVDEIAKVVSDVAIATTANPDLVEAIYDILAGPKGASATVAFIGNDEKPGGFGGALKAAAAKHGWAFREMGGPSRFLVAAAPADSKDAVVAAAVRWGGQALALKAKASLDPKTSHEKAALVAAAALALDPKNAHANEVAATVVWANVYGATPRGSLEPAIARLRAALDASASFPFTPEENWTARGTLGMYLVLQGGHDPEAVEILKKVIEKPVGPDPDGAIWNHRYNLACALARSKRGDEAFSVLEKVVEQHAKTPLFGIDAWRDDTDLESLHADPRWKALLEKYPEDAGGK